MRAESLSLAEARARVRAAVRPLAGEEVALAGAVGRALRTDVRAPHALPPFRNSSMDGFAVRARDGDGWRRVHETLAAGATAARPVGAGEATRIMTGAPIPEGADAVVPFEEADEDEEAGAPRMRARGAVAPAANVRDAGADLAAGAVALPAGRTLGPHDVGLLAALGVTHVPVGGVPRAAIVSTGDELLPPDAPLTPGRIRDSNRPVLELLLAEAGARVVSSVHAPDDPARVEVAIREALAAADVVLTIGGVSAGDFDPVKQSLDAIGGIALWRVAMKPGRPQAFGSPAGRLFFGLPGNPASVACVFEVLVRPALRALAGHREVERPRLDVRVAERLESRAGRTDFVRATLAREVDGWWARPAGAQVSGHLTPQSRAHVLVEIPERTVALEPGDAASAILLRWPEHDGM